MTQLAQHCRRIGCQCILLSILFLISIEDARCSDVMQSQTNIRKGSTQNAERLSNHVHPIRRVYSPENSDVRDEIHKIETRENHYWTTGIRGDPSFEIDYNDHPYDPQSSRKLQDGDTDESVKESYFEPLRIHVEASALDDQKTSSNGAKIDFIKNEILPRMTQFWTDALSVVPVNGNLRIQGNDLISGFCGDSEFSEVPGEHLGQGVPDTDLILYISGTPSSRFCGPTTLAVAVACNWDQFDRPTAGAINFCIDQVQVDASGSAHPSVISDNVDVAIHEAGHVLGMSSNSYRFFWDPSTGRPRTARPIRAQDVTCVDGTKKLAFVPDENTLKFIESEQGVRAAVIVTEKVRTIAQNQFNCDQIEGAQLEVSSFGSFIRHIQLRV